MRAKEILRDVAIGFALLVGGVFVIGVVALMTITITGHDVLTVLKWGGCFVGGVVFGIVGLFALFARDFRMWR